MNFLYECNCSCCAKKFLVQSDEDIFRLKDRPESDGTIIRSEQNYDWYCIHCGYDWVRVIYDAKKQPEK